MDEVTESQIGIEGDSYFGFKLADEESERHFRELADSAPVLIWVSGVERRCSWFNRQWLEFTGRSMKDELRGGRESGIHPDDVVRWKRLDKSSFKARKPYRTEYRMRRHDGEYRWIQDDSIPRYAESGEFLGYIGSCTDITDSRRASEALAESEARFERCVSGTMEGLWEWQIAGTYWGNRRFWELFGDPGHDAYGGVDEWNQRIHPEDVEPFWRAMQAHFDGQNETFSMEFRMGDAGTGYRWLEIRGTAVRSDQGDPILIAGSMSDIQPQKELEFSLREQVAQRDRFLAMLSHELRNPLGAVLNASNVLDTASPDDEDRVEALAVLREQARHMGRLLDDLLDVSRVTTGRFEMRKARFDLRLSMRDAARSVHAQFVQKQLTLTGSQPKHDVFVFGDRDRLLQAQVNLLSNACRYSPAGTQVRYWLAVENDVAIVSVADQGNGLDESLRDRVFELFVQGEQGLAHADGGMGVGLSLVKTIVEAHDGTITAASPGPGLGSTFTIRLPLCRNEAIVELSPEPRGVNVTRRVVLVDDMVGGRRMLARWLKRAGIEVIEATTGQEGLDAAVAEQPDACIVDIGLPDIDGYEVARRLRSDEATRHLFLIALTGYGRSEDRELSREAGFDAHLVKPVDPEALLKTLASGIPGGTDSNGSGDETSELVIA